MVDGPTTLPGLLEDLALEHHDLDAWVAPLGSEGWDLATPAAPWAVRDQVSHLAFFDDAATLAITDPARFERLAETVLEAQGDPMEDHLRRGRALDGADVLGWWRTSRGAMLDAASTLSAHDRVSWFGPPMGALSFMSARLMETWAHGQDVADALGVVRVPTDRLRHVAHLGVRTRAFSFTVRGLEVPTDDVRVELTGPSGHRWEWGAPQASSQVRGSALDFCLVVTQRRHVADTSLAVQGAAATQWLAIAQAFAGPPGTGRPPSVIP